MSGFVVACFSSQPNPAFKRDAAQARRPLTLRWANMKILITSILIISSLHAGSIMAEGICATELCENAQKISGLPSDVTSFVDQRDGCDHFRGEPWDGGDDPEIKERREFIFQNIKNLCTGTDMRLEKLRHKYRHNQEIVELLKEYEDQIERK